MAYVEFDADEVMQEFGDASVVSELAGIVRTDLGGYARTLEAAYAAGNLEEVRRTAHAIKGAAGNWPRVTCARWRRRSTTACGPVRRTWRHRRHTWLPPAAASSTKSARGSRRWDRRKTQGRGTGHARARVRRRQRDALRGQADADAAPAVHRLGVRGRRARSRGKFSFILLDVEMAMSASRSWSCCVSRRPPGPAGHRALEITMTVSSGIC